MHREFPLIFRLTAGLLFNILFICGLFAAKDILVPLAFATLLAFLLYPISSFNAEMIASEFGVSTTEQYN